MHMLLFAVKFLAIWFVLATVAGISLGHFIEAGRHGKGWERV